MAADAGVISADSFLFRFAPTCVAAASGSKRSAAALAIDSVDPAGAVGFVDFRNGKELADPDLSAAEGTDES